MPVRTPHRQKIFSETEDCKCRRGSLPCFPDVAKETA